MTDRSVCIRFLHVQSLSPTVALWMSEDHPSPHREAAEEPRTCDRITEDSGHAGELISNAM